MCVLLKATTSIIVNSNLFTKLNFLDGEWQAFWPVMIQGKFQLGCTGAAAPRAPVGPSLAHVDRADLANLAITHITFGNDYNAGAATTYQAFRVQGEYAVCRSRRLVPTSPPQQAQVKHHSLHLPSHTQQVVSSHAAGNCSINSEQS